MVHLSPDAAPARAERSEGPLSPGQRDGPLDLHWGICDPEAERAPTGCPRSRDEHRLISAAGRVVRVRCKGPNLCLYCRTLSVVETVEMLTLDALEYAPAIGVVLTAREHLTRKQTYSHLRQLRRAVRRHWPAAEWFVVVEFQLRGALHLNLLVKGVESVDVAQFREVVFALWCSRVDAERSGQWCEAFSERAGGAEGFVRYVAKVMAHGLKPSQAPPLGWRGHRTSHTRGYLVRPTPIMRAEAQASLRMKRELHRAIAEGRDAHDAELVARERLAANSAENWTFVSAYTIATETGWDQLGREMARRDVEPDPMTWEDVDLVVVADLTCAAACAAYDAELDRADGYLDRWSGDASEAPQRSEDAPPALGGSPADATLGLVGGQAGEAGAKA